MRASEFWHKVIMDKSDLIDDSLAIINQKSIHYCIIGWQAVNAYVEPLVSLDLDIVITLVQINGLVDLLKERNIVQEFTHTMALSL